MMKKTKKDATMTIDGAAIATTKQDRHSAVAVALAGLTKHQRERVLLEELQDAHGYILSDVPRQAEQHTMHFYANRVTGKYKLVAARVMRVSMPEDSWLAKYADASAKMKKARADAKEKAKADAKAKAKTKAKVATNPRKDEET